MSWFSSLFHKNSEDRVRDLRDSTLASTKGSAVGGFMGHQKDLENAINGSFEKGGPVKKTGIYRLHKGEYVLNRKKAMARKMNKNDADNLKEFSRIDKDSGRAFYKYPEGRYKRVGDTYERQDDKQESVLHG